MSDSNNTITLPYNFEPRAYQLDFYRAMDNGCKRAFKRWCRRAGKDVCDWNFMIKKAFERVGNYYYVFPAYAQAKKAIWEGKTKDQYPYLRFIPDGLAKSNSNELLLTLVNGSTIRLVGSDNVDALRGAGPCGVVFSEYAWQGNDVWDTVRPMLLENDGWAVFNSTPQGKNHMYDLEVKITGNEDWYFSELQCLWPDRPNFYPVISVTTDKKWQNKEIPNWQQYMELATQETINAIEKERKAGMEEEFIEQEYGVSYVAGQKGNYYIDCINQANKEKRIGQFHPEMGAYVDTFWDIGRTDDTVVWFRQIIGNKLVWVDYYENNTQGMIHYIHKLREKGYRYRTHFLPWDGSHGTFQTGETNKGVFIKMCESAGISADVVVAQRPSSKQLPITLVRERFNRYYFNEGLCADGLKKLSLYHRQYDRNTKTFRDFPAHDWCSHAADAISIEALTADMNDNYLKTTQPIENIQYDFDPFSYMTGEGNYEDS